MAATPEHGFCLPQVFRSYWHRHLVSKMNRGPSSHYTPKAHWQPGQPSYPRSTRANLYTPVRSNPPVHSAAGRSGYAPTYAPTTNPGSSHTYGKAGRGAICIQKDIPLCCYLSRQPSSLYLSWGEGGGGGVLNRANLLLTPTYNYHLAFLSFFATGHLFW